jgi:hypothetical protein
VVQLRAPGDHPDTRQLTVDDPKAYTKSWTTTIRLSLALNTELLEYICNENEKSVQHLIGANAEK